MKKNKTFQKWFLWKMAKRNNIFNLSPKIKESKRFHNMIVINNVACKRLSGIGSLER